MFGCSARLGVGSIGLPMDEIDGLQSEVDIATILKVDEAQVDQPDSVSLDVDQSPSINDENNGPSNSHELELGIKY